MSRMLFINAQVQWRMLGSLTWKRDRNDTPWQSAMPPRTCPYTKHYTLTQMLSHTFVGGGFTKTQLALGVSGCGGCAHSLAHLLHYVAYVYYVTYADFPTRLTRHLHPSTSTSTLNRTDLNPNTLTRLHSLFKVVQRQLQPFTLSRHGSWVTHLPNSCTAWRCHLLATTRGSCPVLAKPQLISLHSTTRDMCSSLTHHTRPSHQPTCDLSLCCPRISSSSNDATLKCLLPSPHPPTPEPPPIV